ncbi:baseplate J/gp47 family protein [Lysinibacillus sphaericus]|uniref:baseplate J/gp47 family protein n=1 Tax=Lysinibacillus sphaericus TaxID=1421 RepID=UPI003D7F9C7F
MVEEKVSSKRVRPLTDKVAVNAPTTKGYEVNVEYWIARKNATVSTIIETQVKAAFEAYLKWQREKMGRDVGSIRTNRTIKTSRSFTCGRSFADVY